MRLIVDRSADLCAWAADRIPYMHGRDFGPATAMGIECPEGLGVVVFHDWQPDYGTLQVSAYSETPRWMLARDCWRVMWDYAYRTCGAQKIWTLTPRTNVRALRFVKALGFKPEAVLARQYGYDDAVLSRKFVEEHYEQAKASDAA